MVSPLSGPRRVFGMTVPDDGRPLQARDCLGYDLTMKMIHGAVRCSVIALLFAVLAGCSAPTTRAATVNVAQEPATVPAWVFPLGPPAPRPSGVRAPDAAALIRLPNSSAAFTRAQLSNRFVAPDWYPRSHGPMPEVVARGRAPDLYACGYCHTPGGQGRPENAPLAGLPSAYIVQQVMEFQSGARRALLPGVFPPADLMIHEAMMTTPAEAASAGEYFSREKLRPKVVVLERASVPRTQVVGSVYTPI